MILLPVNRFQHVEIRDQQLYIYGMERLIGSGPTSLPCVRYCSHRVSHRRARKASADNPLSTTVKKRGWSSSCQLVAVRGKCFTDCIFLWVLCSNACFYRTNSENIAMTSLCSYYCFSERDNLTLQKCQSALLNHVLKRNFCKAMVGCGYTGQTIVISYCYYCVLV